MKQIWLGYTMVIEKEKSGGYVFTITDEDGSTIPSWVSSKAAINLARAILEEEQEKQ